jgi:hypothetical protein
MTKTTDKTLINTFFVSAVVALTFGTFLFTGIATSCFAPQLLHAYAGVLNEFAVIVGAFVGFLTVAYFSVVTQWAEAEEYEYQRSGER